LGAALMTQEKHAWWDWHPNDDLMPGPPPDRWMAPLVRWDANYYVTIARRGYPDASLSRPVVYAIAFFPLFPLMIRWLAALGCDIFWSAFLLSNAAALVAALFLATTCRSDSERSSSLRAAMLFLASPGSNFLSYPYPEAVFAACIAGGTYFIVRNRPFAAMLAAAAASATRSAGVVLSLAFLFIAVQRRGDRTAMFRWLGAAAGGCLGVIAFALFCSRKYGDPLAFAHIQDHYGRSLGVLNPLRALVRFNVDPDYYVVTLAAAAVATLMVFREFNWRSLAATFLLLLPMATGTLKAMIRYQGVNTPLLAGAAEMLRGKRFVAAMVVCLSLMCLEAFLYGKGFAHY
jgi:hypothetical protein